VEQACYRSGRVGSRKSRPVPSLVCSSDKTSQLTAAVRFWILLFRKQNILTRRDAGSQTRGSGSQIRGAGFPQFISRSNVFSGKIYLMKRTTVYSAQLAHTSALCLICWQQRHIFMQTITADDLGHFYRDHKTVSVVYNASRPCLAGMAVLKVVHSSVNIITFQTIRRMQLARFIGVCSR